MHLRRAPTPPRLISLVSMVDVLLIMLVFFMVTSTYLNLDMIPVAQGGDAAEPNTTNAEVTAPLVVRLGADGAAYLRGQKTPMTALSARVATLPAGASVTILPSLRADTQALVSLMDVLTQAGASNLRVLQVSGR